MRPLVIGVGNRWRGDDGIGPAVVEALERLDDCDADLVALDGEPARIVEAWNGRTHVVVVDAVVAGDPPGTIHHLTDTDRLPTSSGVPGSHGAGVAEAVTLGRALGRLPARLVVIGVDPAAVGQGAGLSPRVAASFDAVVRLVREEVGVTCA